MDFKAMTHAQLDEYAKGNGIDLAGSKTREDKIRIIREREGEGKIEVTALGITVEIAENAFDDFDVIEDFGKMQDGDIFVFPKLVKSLFGDDFARIRKHLQNEEGKLTVTKATEFFTEVIKEVGAKN